MKDLSRKLGFFTAFLIPMLVITGFYLGGYWNFLPVVFSFLLLPFIDQSIGIDASNVPRDQLKTVGNDVYYRLVTYIWAFVQLAFVVWAAFAFTSGKLAGGIELTAFILGCALVTGGIGITVAHELGHRSSPVEKFYAKVLLLTVCYMHFIIEHNRGHHVFVATPEDPATARKDENFYSFWVRSVFGGYWHAWKLEAENLRRKDRRPFSVYNNMVWFAILPVLFCAALTGAVSIISGSPAWGVPIFFFAQSVVAFTLLELVNYVEHYGILRKQLSPGRYERVDPRHSWNASHVLSNFFLFQLQRHSDHHVHAYKRYQVLDHYDESPQLPFGYPTMIIIALVPPLWFYMMNRRLDRWRNNLPVQAL